MLPCLSGSSHRGIAVRRPRTEQDSSVSREPDLAGRARSIFFGIGMKFCYFILNPAAQGVPRNKSRHGGVMRKGIGWCACSAVLALALCVGAAPAQAATIKVGIVLPLTGEQAKFGEIEKRSFEMAVGEINATGGIRGNKIELVFEDDTGKPDVGRSATEKLISRDKVPVLTGGYSSSVTAAATAVAQQFKVPFLVTTGSADEITEKNYEYVFRINPPASEYPQGVESFLKEIVKPKAAVILYENSLF